MYIRLSGRATRDRAIRLVAGVFDSIVLLCIQCVAQIKTGDISCHRRVRRT
jgi:hypothetical protein